MKLLLVPMLLVLAAVAQVVRIQRVAAEEPQQPPASRSWSLAEEFSIPLAERLENTKRRHAQLLAERQRAVDAAKSSNLPAAQDVSHSGPPLSQEQIDFDRLAKASESFARMNYVIEPPDVLSIRIDYSPSSFNRLDGPISDVELPRLKVAECMDKVPRRHVVGMDAFDSIRSRRFTSLA